MSPTIWGDYLQPGHCEIHPDVPEPYPCVLCVADDRARETRRAAFHAAECERVQAHYSELHAEFEAEQMARACVGLA